jgi:hypothetical protein
VDVSVDATSLIHTPSPNRPRFQHSPLEDPGCQLRLLNFSQPHSDADIACELSTWDHDTAPPYAAVSYVWSEPTAPVTITINGHLFDVGRNCHYALWQVSQHLQPQLQYFWMDAICIDQQNSDERGFQVQQMGRFFEGAEVVFSCVGPHGDGSELVLTALLQLKELVRELLQSRRLKPAMALFPKIPKWSVFREILSRQWSALESPGSFYDFLRDWYSAYRALGDRTYWSRLWIYQEVRLARDLRVLCGSSAMHSSSLLTASHTTVTWGDLTSSGVSTEQVKQCPWPEHWHRINMWFMLADFPGPISDETKIRGRALEQMMWLTCKLDCLDFPDHLYGILHVVRWPTSRTPKPDYTIDRMGLVFEL